MLSDVLSDAADGIMHYLNDSTGLFADLYMQYDAELRKIAKRLDEIRQELDRS